ncbi:uncharacterized protein LOC121870529 [Homarus americanus]|uniref:uncharacterized protein LOC121870529 n=1 Tax=Homarus americanus TaxID=6706 RepID=UPI001C438D34|nr:uncharacterized protein LOC121870529 [Homarus americanus]
MPSFGVRPAPGDDGATYSVLRLFLNVTGNLLLSLYNLCLHTRYVCAQYLDWTSGTIVPIPKCETAKFRPISLTSCFRKVMERILLTCLMFRLEYKLTQLIWFSTTTDLHHCLLKLYTRLSCMSAVAFIDLKCAFDVANRDIIFVSLVDFGAKANFLRWIRGYLRKRTSRGFFKGACSSTKGLQSKYSTGWCSLPLSL